MKRISRFTFVGNTPVDKAGEIGLLVSGGVTYIVAETDGVAGSDMCLQTSQTVGAWAQADFIL